MQLATIKKLDKIITEFRQQLEKLYGDKLINLVLYGSQARGDATENSDIDIMVILKNPVSPGDEIFRMGEIKNQLNLKYDQLISIFPISQEDFFSKQTPLLDNIRREGVVL
jgi:predicted nucleotidyltransferase